MTTQGRPMTPVCHLEIVCSIKDSMLTWSNRLTHTLKNKLSHDSAVLHGRKWISNTFPRPCHLRARRHKSVLFLLEQKDWQEVWYAHWTFEVFSASAGIPTTVAMILGGLHYKISSLRGWWNPDICDFKHFWDSCYHCVGALLQKSEIQLLLAKQFWDNLLSAAAFMRVSKSVELSNINRILKL